MMRSNQDRTKCSRALRESEYFEPSYCDSINTGWQRNKRQKIGNLKRCRKDWLELLDYFVELLLVLD
jgi:hypothetical protein